MGFIKFPEILGILIAFEDNVFILGWASPYLQTCWELRSLEIKKKNNNKKPKLKVHMVRS